MVIVLAFVMLQEKNGRDLDKVSVIIQNSDDNQWSAFKYGLRMAAEDRKIENVCRQHGGHTDCRGGKEPDRTRD